jgi:hypothetical protein
VNRIPRGRRPIRRWGLGLGLVVVAIPWIGTVAHATPRYAARFDQSCALCHDDPSGGGKRSLYAAQYLVPAEMVMHPLGEEALARIQPAFGPNLSVGLDLRTLHHYTDRPNSLPNGFGVPNFLQMEGNLYLTFQPDPRVSACVVRGISGSYEIYGLIQGLPASGHVRVGRFVTPYGWRLADHTAFVRAFGGFMPPAHSDVGVEVGLFPGRWELQLAATNGAGGVTQDVDRDLAFSARAARRLRLGMLSVALGGSYSHNGSPSVMATAAGPFASLGWKRIVWLGEADWSRHRIDRSFVRGLDLSQELAFPLHRGWDLIATHDYHDPDVRKRTGALNRIGVGFELFPLPFLHLRALANTYETQPAAGGPHRDCFQSEVQVHFLY